MTTTKEKFIRDLIDELNDINDHAVKFNGESPKVDVPYVISVIDQQLDKCTEFLEDISKNTYCINGFDEDTTGGYTNGRIRILIEKDDKKESDLTTGVYYNYCYYNYCYYINFLYDDRMWGYCQCTPEDEGYNEKHDCCGNSCDWHAPSFRIEKVITIDSGSWDGQQKDYWKYEEQFLVNEQNKNVEVEKFEREQKRKNLENQIKKLQEELSELAS